MNSDKKRTIYLYIGMGKTGSSSVHQFLIDNKKTLLEKQVLFPEVENKEHIWVPMDYINFELLIHQFRVDEIDISEFTTRFNSQFVSQLDRTTCNNMILLSDEMFNLKDKMDFLDVFFELGFEVKVIVYIRRPSEYLASAWGEELKPNTPIAKRITLEESFDNREICFSTVFSFIEKLGKENVIVRPFEKEQWKNNDLIEDWLSCIGVELTNEFVSAGWQNPSFSRNTSEIFLLVNRMLLPLDEIQQLKKRIVELSEDDYPSITDTLSDRFIDMVTEHYRPMYERLAETYGYDHFFVNEYPNCYRKHENRKEFKEIVLSSKQLTILYEAMERQKKYNRYIFNQDGSMIDVNKENFTNNHETLSRSESTNKGILHNIFKLKKS